MDLYVDGSYKPEPTTSVYQDVGVGIYTAKKEVPPLSIRVYKSKFTNDDMSTLLNHQTAEVIAVYLALWLTQYRKKVNIYSDSQHCVDSLTESYERYQQNNWVTTKNKPVAHRDLLKRCGEIISARKEKRWKTKIVKVQGHSGNSGNEMADKLAYDAIANTNYIGNSTMLILSYSSIVSNNVATNADLLRLRSTIGIIPKEVSVVPEEPKVDEKLEGTKLSEFIEDISASTEHNWVHILNNYVNNCKDTMPKKIAVSPYSSWKDPEPLYGEATEETADVPAVEPTTDELLTEGVSAEELPVESKEFTEDNECNIGNNEVENSEQYYLFLTCIECTGMILVKYPNTASCKLKKELGLDYQSILTFTTCKDCIVKHTPDFLLKSILDITSKKGKFVEQLRMSPNMFKGSDMYQCARIISGTSPGILTDFNIVRYIAIGEVIELCNSECIASTINTDTNEVLPYFRFGFL